MVSYHVYNTLYVLFFQKKKGKDHCNKENTLARKAAALDSSNSNFGLAEDSNTCKFMVSI